MNLEHKTVVIVGGSQGIGRAIAKLLVERNSKVVIVSRREESAQTAARELNCSYKVADVRDEACLRTVADEIAAEYGSIDLWLNSAGVFKAFPKDDLIDKDRSLELLETNFMGVVYGTRSAMRQLSDDGLIVTILSSAALDASRAVGAKLYAASKWAVRGWIDAFRGENPDFAKRMIGVYPGGTKTHLHDEALPDAFDDFMDASYVAEKIVSNLELDEPEQDQVIRRPTVQ